MVSQGRRVTARTQRVAGPVFTGVPGFAVLANAASPDPSTARAALPEPAAAPVPAEPAAWPLKAWRPRRREPRGASRFPMRPMRAGTAVRATSTATATTAAEAIPMVVRNPIPATLRPHRATTTVVPAKTTALPAVATARPAASAGATPSARYSRAREMMNRA